MRRNDLLFAFAAAVLAHIALFFAPGISSEARVAFQSGDSALTLLIMPAMASQEMHKTPEPPAPPRPEEPPKKDPPKPVATKPTPKTREPKPPAPRKVTSEYEVAQIPNLIPPVKVHTVPPPDDNDTDRAVADVQDPTVRIEDVEAPPPKPSEDQAPAPNAVTNPGPRESAPSKESAGDMRRKGVSSSVACSNLQKPEYPSCCRRKGHEGVVILEVTILANGECSDIRVLQSGGCPRMDEAAMEALRRATFAPARAFGVPITSTKKLKFVFRLTDEEEN